MGSIAESPPGTVKCRLAAIRFTHKRAGFASPFDSAPTFEAVYQGYLRRWAGSHRPKQSAATEDVVKQMVNCWREGDVAVRNRAILLIGFDAALRRSEIVGIDTEHCSWDQDGLLLYLPQSKGDQLGEGNTILILRRTASAYCPVESLSRWLQIASITEGPIFRRFHRNGKQTTLGTQRLSCKSIYNLVKQSAKKAGIEGNFGAHSLRRGFINSAVRESSSLTDVQQHVRHKSLETTSRYLRTQPTSNHPGNTLLGGTGK